jgi:hypothetical protein
MSKDSELVQNLGISTQCYSWWFQVARGTWEVRAASPFLAIAHAGWRPAKRPLTGVIINDCLYFAP